MWRGHEKVNRRRFYRFRGVLAGTRLVHNT
nr:MAG TPA: hypothetical protein [Caudoviricetes sp.]